MKILGGLLFFFPPNYSYLSPIFIVFIFTFFLYIWSTSIPCLSQVHVMPLCFYETPTLDKYLFLLAKRNLRIFAFVKKGDNSAQHLFCSKLLKRQFIPWAEHLEWCRQAPSLGTTFSITILASGCHSFEFCYYLCFIWTCLCIY